MPAKTIELTDVSEYEKELCDGENSFFIKRYSPVMKGFMPDGMLLSPKIKRRVKWDKERGYDVITFRLYIDVERKGDYAALVYFYDYKDRALALKCLQGLTGLLIGSFNMGDWYFLNGLRGWKVI